MYSVSNDSLIHINSTFALVLGILHSMKKLYIALFVPLVFSSSSISFAQTSTCVDLKRTIVRRQENNDVLTLQNFLFEKGYLKVKPNGFYGPSTFNSVRLFQKDQGLEQTGNAGPLTRSVIKRVTCTTTAQATSNVVSTPKQPASSNTQAPQTIKPAVVNTPSGLRNAKRRDDLELLLRAIYARYVDSRQVHPVKITDVPIKLCIPPPYVMPSGTTTEVAVLASPVSPCKDFVDVGYLQPVYFRFAPRDPSLATSSVMLGYSITRDEYNTITLSADSPEDNAIIKVTCNFNGYCKDIKHISTITYKAPVIASTSIPFLLRDTVPKKPLTIYGNNFTATNTVVLQSRYTLKKYPLGTFSSTDGTSFTIPASSTNQLISCGDGCTEKIPLGEYEFQVTNAGGPSNLGYITFKGFNTSSINARADMSATPNTKSLRIGTITISSSIPITLNSITFVATSSSAALPGKITNFVLKNSSTNTAVGSGGGTIALSKQSLFENESKIYDVFVDIADVPLNQSGNISYGGYFTATDSFAKTDLELPIKPISFSVSY